ncbi:MAG: hypothetical protein ABI132_01615 [Rhodanobacteraceae bacterium]
MKPIPLTKPIAIACALALSVSLAVAIPAAQAHQGYGAADAAPAAATKAPQLHAAMRSLWHGHIEATRAYAMAVKAADTAGAKKAADDVVANARQIANAVGGFYGPAAGTQMLKLLSGHWSGVKSLADADHANDSAAHAKAMHELTGNATAIAKFLSGANPNLSDATVRGLMMMHVADHETHIRAIMQGDTQAEASTWTEMQTHMNTIADALADGIAKQFPAKAK